MRMKPPNDNALASVEPTVYNQSRQGIPFHDNAQMDR